MGATLRESVLSPTGIGLALLVVLLATTVVAAATASPPAHDRGRIGSIDVAALAAVAVVVAALVGGAADESQLEAGGGSGLVLLLLPGLIAFAAAVAAARLFGPLVRIAGRALHRSVGARLAAVSLGRGPGAAAVTVAFLTLAFALALLAEGYRSTLVRAEGAASFAVPLDILVREDLSRSFPCSTLRRSSATGRSPARTVWRCRFSGRAPAQVAPRASAGSPCWRCPRPRSGDCAAGAAASPRSRSSLVSAVTPPSGASLLGVALGRRLTLAAGPGVLSLRAVVAGKDGRFTTLELGALKPHATTHVDRELPAHLRGGKLVAIELVPPRLVDRGADAGHPLAGRLRLTGLGAATWLGEGGIVATPVPDGIDLTFRISQQNDARVRVRQPTDDRPPAVLVTPRLGVLAGGPGGTCR